MSISVRNYERARMAFAAAQGLANAIKTLWDVYEGEPGEGPDFLHEIQPDCTSRVLPASLDEWHAEAQHWVQAWRTVEQRQFDLIQTAKLYNNRTDFAPIQPGEFTGLTLGGCATQEDNSGRFTLGGVPAERAEFFTVYGITHDAEHEAITDAKTPLEAMEIAAELSRLHELPVTLAPTL